MFALGAGSCVFAGQAFQFQAGDGEARAGAGVFFGQFALFVIEGQGVFFAGLLGVADLFQLLGHLGGAAFEVFEVGGERFAVRVRGFPLGR